MLKKGIHKGYSFKNKKEKEKYMEAKEILEKIKHREANYRDLVQWCDDNKFNMNLNNKLVYNLYNTMVNYAINVKKDNLDEKEASIFICFFVKKKAIELGIDKLVSIEILGKDEYEKKHGKNSKAKCIQDKKCKFKLIYSQKIVEELMSTNQNEFLRGMQTIFHEIRHVAQNLAMQIDSTKLYKKSIYIMALETITRNVSSEFYKDNYKHLIRENDAEKYGLKIALQTIKEININLYNLFDEEKIKKKMKIYEDNFYKSDLEIIGLQGSAIKVLDTMTEVCISKHTELLNEYPILKLGYNENGTKKDIKQLLEDRDKLINERPKVEIDDLYNVIINQKFFDYEEGIGTKDELLALDEYVEKTGTDDEFIYNLVRIRLNRSKWTEKEKEKFILREKEKARKVRKLRKKEDRKYNYKENKQAKRIESISDELNDIDLQEIKNLFGGDFTDDFER